MFHGIPHVLTAHSLEAIRPWKTEQLGGGFRRADHPAEGRRTLGRRRTGVIWIQEVPPVYELREILSAATVFVCPSIYEPLSIVNLEAMTCATAVAASAVGGIPEVVTGALVHYDADDAAGFAASKNSLGPTSAEQTLDVYRKVCA